MPYGAKLDVVKEEVRVVPVGQGGSQGGPIWSWWKSGGFQFVKDEVRGVPVGQLDLFSIGSFLNWIFSQLEKFGNATLCYISTSQEQRNVAYRCASI